MVLLRRTANDALSLAFRVRNRLVDHVTNAAFEHSPPSFKTPVKPEPRFG